MHKIPDFNSHSPRIEKFLSYSSAESESKEKICFEETREIEYSVLESTNLLDSIPLGDIVKRDLDEKDPLIYGQFIPSEEWDELSDTWKSYSSLAQSDFTQYVAVDYSLLEQNSLEGDNNPTESTLTLESTSAQTMDVIVDRVNFSAFGPPLVYLGSSFRIYLWAYLATQRERMLQEAEVEAGETNERGMQLHIPIERGSVITAILELPLNKFAVLGENYKRFFWDGDISKCSFEVRSLTQEERMAVGGEERVGDDQKEEFPTNGEVIGIIRLVYGLQVTLLHFTFELGLFDGEDISEDYENNKLRSWMDQIHRGTNYIEESEIVLGELLGRGNFGEVYEGFYQGSKVAIKRLRISDEESLDHEVSIMQLLGQHPNIANYLGVWKPSARDALHMVMKLYSGGSLDKKLCCESVDFVNTQVKFQRLSDVSHGLLNLHQSNILHRDIAARNCLISGR